MLKSYKFFLNYIFILYSCFFISRFFLVFSYDIDLDLLFFVYSLRMDTIIVSSFLLIAVFLFSFNLLKLTRFWIVFTVLLVIYFEVVNYFFFEEFNTRLNYLFIDYLKYPKEIFKMIWDSYAVSFIFLIFFLMVCYFLINKYFFNKIQKSSILLKLFLFPFILVILFIGIRSSFSAAAPNESFYSYSNSPMKNDMANNTIFSILRTLYLKTGKNLPYYGEYEKETLIKNIQTYQGIDFINDSSLLHKQKSTFVKKDKVVLTIIESFGSLHVGALGGTPTTPFFDKMSKEGLFLSNMYSSSGRSNRGFEAILSSIYPSAIDSYLILPKSQKNFYSIARTYKKNGYKSVFLYGGDSNFDNMKSFALSNGFDEIVDINDFDSSIKRFTWGVSDEELFKKANEILSESKKPIFLVMFTLSSHKPFDYPDNKIKLYSKAPKKSFENSIKYTDFALNNFYQGLKAKNFFDNGVLAIVADHNAHISGKYIIPVNEYKIPALFISKDLKVKENSNITHQVDIAPTLLDISGLDVIAPFMGNNLTKTDKSKAIIVHNGNMAFLKDDSFVLYQDNKKPKMFNFNYEPIQDDLSKIKEGLNYIYGSDYIYNKNLHKDIN